MSELSRELNLEIENIYSQRRNLAQAQAEQRRLLTIAQYPRIEELEDVVNQKGLIYLQSSLGEDETVRQQADRDLDKAEQRLKDYLLEKGIPLDYAEPVWHCSKCQDTGLVEGCYCTCYEELRQALLSQMLPSALLPGVSFDQTDPAVYPEEIIKNGQKSRPREHMKIMLDIARTYSQHFSLLENKNLFFSGQEGSGKTWLISCIASAVMAQGYSVFVLSAAVFFDFLQEWNQQKISFRPDPDRYKELQILTEALWNCDLLILDDLGSEIQKDLSYSDLLLLLDQRQQEGRHTIITSNLNAVDLQKIYDKRVASRISGNFLCYKMPEVDLRLIRSQQ